MKKIYCISSIIMAIFCGMNIALGNWGRAIIEVLCAFINAMFFVSECNRGGTDE